MSMNIQFILESSIPVDLLPQQGGGSALGQGGAMFYLTFEDKWFIKDYVLIPPSKTQVRIMGEPIPNGVNWDYPVRLINPDPEVSFPVSDLQAGTPFAQLFAPVGTDWSRGNASNWAAPFKVRQKIGTIRKSYEFAGKAKNFVAEFEFTLQNGRGKSKLWMDFEEWQYFLQWKTECEMLYWYGEKTYNEAGITSMKDERGQPVIVGPGLLQQIQNKDTYSELTTNKLKNVIRDTFYGMTDQTNRQVTLYTGTGGKEEFNNALQAELAAKNFMVLDQNKFVTGSGRAMTLSGYFTTYEHIDGHTINVVTMPQFDHGPVAETSERHPRTGLPLESYRMVFVDQTNYDGEPNVKMVNYEGREFLRWCVPGSIVPRGFEQTTTRASDVDGASVHFLKEGGILLRRFDTSFDLECVV